MQSADTLDLSRVLWEVKAKMADGHQLIVLLTFASMKITKGFTERKQLLAKSCHRLSKAPHCMTEGPTSMHKLKQLLLLACKESMA